MREHMLQLEAAIDAHNGLYLLMADAHGTKQPFVELADITSKHPEATAITVEVRDFHHEGVMYRIYGLTLDEDGEEIQQHWPRTQEQNGITYTFQALDPENGEIETFIIGAIPQNAAVPEPAPFESDAPNTGGLLEEK